MQGRRREQEILGRKASTVTGCRQRQKVLAGCFLPQSEFMKYRVGRYFYSITIVFMSEIEEIRSSARQGDADAQFRMGLIYDNGDGVKRDPVVAANWYRFAAEQGHARGQLHLGLILNAGDTALERDDTDAAQWFLKAAEQGLADAQFNLALMYYNAEGVEQNDPEAFRWFQTAAEQGHPKAQFNLGAMYANGHGVEQNNAEVYKWWLLAIMQGDPNANENLEMIRDKLSAEDADAAQAAAVDWFNSFQK